MLVRMNEAATEQQYQSVVQCAHGLGARIHRVPRSRNLVLHEGSTAVDEAMLRKLPGVEDCKKISAPYELVSREGHPEDTVVTIGDLRIGGDAVAVMAGPCSVENRRQMLDTAEAVGRSGAGLLRGGAFKPRTSPYEFQGLQEEGLELLVEARERTGLPFVTEVIGVDTLPLVASVADVLQIGARNVQNYPLLRAVGRTQKPVLLKRGMSMTIKEWLFAAEYILAEGNPNVMLCERGLRSFDCVTRNVLDIGMIPALRVMTHLPIVLDPSHATGRSDSVPAVARAAVAVGADAVMVEVHPNPEVALSDGPQSLTFDQFHEMMDGVRAVAHAVGRTIHGDNRAAKVTNKRQREQVPTVPPPSGC